MLIKFPILFVIIIINFSQNYKILVNKLDLIKLKIPQNLPFPSQALIIDL